MLSATSRLLGLVIDGVAPARCAGCGGEAPAALCPGCADRLAAHPSPPPRRVGTGVVVAAYSFDGLPRRILVAGKYRGRRSALHLLACLAAERLLPVLSAGGAPTALVPVPLGRRRRRARGYNQAAVVAEALAELPGAAPVIAGLRRVRETPGQVGRGAAERRANLRGAMAWSGPRLAASAVVWLVDDVATTGATFDAAAAALQREGVTRIERVAVARRL